MAKIIHIEALYFGDKGAGWSEDKKVPIVGATYGVNLGEINTTDSSTTGDGEEVSAGKGDRTSKIDGFLYVGGKKVNGSTSKLTFNGTDYPVTSSSYSEVYNEIDTTDTSNTGTGKETSIGKAKRTSKISAWVHDDKDDIALGTPQTATLLFATGASVSGTALPISKELQAKINEAAKIDYNFNWNGALTEVLTGLPVVGVEKDCKLVLKGGKIIEGKAIIVSDEISTDINSPINFSLSLKWNGEPTESKTV